MPLFSVRTLLRIGVMVGIAAGLYWLLGGTEDTSPVVKAVALVLALLVAVEVTSDAFPDRSLSDTSPKD